MNQPELGKLPLQVGQLLPEGLPAGLRLHHLLLEAEVLSPRLLLLLLIVSHTVLEVAHFLAQLVTLTVQHLHLQGEMNMRLLSDYNFLLQQVSVA